MKINASRRSRWFVTAVTSAALLLNVAACGATPPAEVNDAAKALPGAIEDAREANDQARSDFTGLLAQEQHAFMQVYTPQQQHADRFDMAATRLDEAQNAYDNTVKPLTDDYKEERLGELEAAIAATNQLIDEARVLTADPPQWAERVAATRADPDNTLREAALALESIQPGHDDLTEDVDTAKETFAHNENVIQEHFQPVSDLYDGAIQANGLLQAEADKASPNYAVMTTHLDTVTNNVATYEEDAPAFADQLALLDVRESHTLLDIRVDSTVEISRTSWNDSLDYPDEHDFDYPEVPVELSTADYFAQFGPDEVLAKVNADFWGDDGDITLDKAEQAQWDTLGIDPKIEWPGDDSAAEFYVGGVYDTYCHQIKMLRDGEPAPKPADNYCSQYDTPENVEQGIYWIEADELNAEAIGMDVYSKGWGDFVDQAATAATPPGMVYVGDTATGEWREDDNGNSFWHYYGQYVFFSQLIGGPYPYHYRYEWDEWNRGYRYNQQPYYSTHGSGPRYGMNSPLFASRFPQSTFATSGLHNLTVRGAGPAARAGGPGGGGK